MDRRLLSFVMIAGLFAVGGLGSMACGQATLVEFSPAGGPTPDYTWRTGMLKVFAAHDCAQPACHSVQTQAGQLVLDPTLDPNLLYTLVVTSGGAIQRAGNGKEADTNNPTNSLLITKPTGTYSPGGHTGGALITQSSNPSSDYQVILNWIKNGAKDN